MITEYYTFQIDVWQNHDGTYSYAFIDPIDKIERRSGKPFHTLLQAVRQSHRHMGRCLNRPYTQRGEVAKGQYWQPEEDKIKKDAAIHKYNTYFEQVQFQRKLDRWTYACTQLILNYPEQAIDFPPKPVLV